MVRNTKGGRSHKKMSSRGTKNNSKQYKLRLPMEEGEIFACVLQLYGYGNAEILCNDGVKRLCIIRKKFRGRRKRDNEIKKGVFVLVGKREFEVRGPGKTEKTDLIYIYSGSQATELKQKGLINNLLLGKEEQERLIAEVRTVQKFAEKEVSTNTKIDVLVPFDDI